MTGTIKVSLVKTRNRQGQSELQVLNQIFHIHTSTDYEHWYTGIKAKICCERGRNQGVIETVVLVKPKNKRKQLPLHLKEEEETEIQKTQREKSMKSDFSGKGLSHRKKEKRMRDTEKRQ